MTMVFQFPDGQTTIGKTIKGTENMYEVKAGFFALAKKLVSLSRTISTPFVRSLTISLQPAGNEIVRNLVPLAAFWRLSEARFLATLATLFWLFVVTFEMCSRYM